ncbi:MAG TPA: diguanylate cyclase [Candidatus Subteraquimicrobiales bacterium]
MVPLENAQRVRALKRIARIVRSLPNFDQALGEIVNTIAEFAEVDFCALYLVDAERREIVLKAAKGVSKKNLGRKVKLGEGFLGKAVETKESFLEEVKEPSIYDLPLWQRKTSSFLILPLIVDGRVVGVLDIRSLSPKPLTQKQILSTILANEIAVLIQGAKLFNETRESLQEHQVLYEIGLLLTSARETKDVLSVILESALRVINAPAGSLALYDEKKEEFSLAVSLGFSPHFAKKSKWKLRKGGLTGQILARNSPLVISDVTQNQACDNPVMIRESIKSLMAVPLRWEGKTVGVLFVDDFMPRDFTSDEVSVFSLLANQATIAIMKAQLLDKTQRLAITDGLTGVFNYRYFQERLEEELKRAERYSHPLSLIIADIDNFKNYNDRHGHLQGNFILKKIVGTIRRATREVDIVARYGGEEFIIILPETDGADALQVAQKIRQAVEKTAFPHEETQPGKKITISLGVATYPDDTRDKKELIDKTDKAMYLSKKQGKNRVSTLKDLLRGNEKMVSNN